MGWLFPLLFGGATLVALKLSGRLNRTALELAVVAVLIGLAGYAWQGSPTVGGSPVASTSHLN
jgi:cytochrome c-type biogenesis protein CcmH